MGVNLFETDTVVIGRFNPHIISPPWLAKEKVVSQGEVEMGISVAGRSVAFRFKTGDLAWQVDQNRLIVSTEKGTNTAEIAAKVVDKLPHTPLTAIGSNFRYRCGIPEWSGRLPKLDDKGLGDLKNLGDTQSVGWKASIAITDDVIVNAEMNLELKEALITLNFNYHRQASAPRDITAAAERFEEDRSASARMIEELFSEKVTQ